MVHTAVVDHTYNYHNYNEMFRQTLPSLRSRISQARCAPPSLLLKYAFSSQQMPSRAAGNRSAADGATKQRNDDDEGKDVLDPHRKYTWDAYFHAKQANDVRSVQDGGFMDISKSDLQKYLPEGLAGDTGRLKYHLKLIFHGK